MKLHKIGGTGLHKSELREIDKMEREGNPPKNKSQKESVTYFV